MDAIDAAEFEMGQRLAADAAGDEAALRRLLANRSPGIRAAAAVALPRTAGVDAVPHLVPLTDPNREPVGEVRAAVIEALGTVPTWAGLNRMLDSLTDPALPARTAAAKAAGDALGITLSFQYKPADPDTWERTQDHLREFARRENIRPRLIEYWERNRKPLEPRGSERGPVTRPLSGATEGVTTHPAATRPVLVTTLPAAPLQWRETIDAAEFAVGRRLAAEAVGDETALRRLLADRSPGIRAAAALSLPQTAGVNAVPQLIVRTDPNHEADGAVRAAAVEALALVPTIEGLDRMLEGLTDPAPPVRVAASFAVSRSLSLPPAYQYDPADPTTWARTQAQYRAFVRQEAIRTRLVEYWEKHRKPLAPRRPSGASQPTTRE